MEKNLTGKLQKTKYGKIFKFNQNEKTNFNIICHEFDCFNFEFMPKRSRFV